jgi:ribosomal protein L40E
MNNLHEEMIIIGIASMILFGVFGAIAFMDRTHGDVGAEYGIDQVSVLIERTEGAIEVPDLPEDLLIYGAGQKASMDFKVVNEDPDTDIDTIYVTIPDSVMTDSEYEWYEEMISHEWNMTNPRSDVTMYQARDDYPGINTGGSAQYDTAGNEDDALDHDATRGISESITVSVEFTAPSTNGFKVGADAIDVEVADLLTEVMNPKESMDPFPFPYIVAQNGDSFVVMVLETASCDLEIVYDGTTYFGSSRSSGFQTFQSGLKYQTEDGQTVVAVAHPGNGKIVKPVVRARSAGLTGQFSLTVFNFTISDITAGEVEKYPVVFEYKDNIPADISTIVDNDIDGDGIYNKLDPDIDGDGQINAEDRDPYNRDVKESPPTGLQASVDKPTVKVDETFTLSAAASDPNADPLTFTWTVDKVPAWSKTGQSIDVKADGDFKPGTYIFSVMVTDGRSAVEPTDTVAVTVGETKGTSNLIFIIPIVVLAIIVLIGTTLFIYGKHDKPAPIEVIESPGKDIPDQGPQKFQDVPITVPVPNASPDNQSAPPVEVAEPASGNVDVCPTCGASLGPEDTKCSACNTEFELTLQCPKCGTEIPPGSESCSSCGLLLII